MKKIYGPYFCAKNVWHWHKTCEDFPHESNAEAMITTLPPENSELCNNCLKLDKEEALKTLSEK